MESHNLACSGIKFDPEKEPRSGQAGTHVYAGILKGDRVAVKRIPNEKSQLFRREADLLQSLDHPNIMKLSLRPHIDEVDGNTFGCLVMPWYDEDLSSLLTGKQPLSALETAQKWILPIALALGYAHRRDITHRDLKPSNILISPTGEPVIADFGVGKNLAASTGETIGAFASLGYTPDIPGDGLHHDVYSFGVIALELLVGQVVRSSAERRMVLQGLELRQDLVGFLRRCLEEIPDNRYRSMAEASDAFAVIVRKLEIQSGQRQVLLMLTRRFRDEFVGFHSSGQGTIEKRLKNLLESSDLNIRPIGGGDGSFQIDDFCVASDEFEIRIEGDPRTGIIRATRFIELTHVNQRPPLSTPLLPFQWRILQRGEQNISTASPIEVKSYRELRATVESWVTRGRPGSSTSQTSASVENLVQQWAKILDATEEVLMGGGDGIDYYDYYFQESDRSIVFRSDFEFEGSIEDTSWEIEGIKNHVGVVTVHQGSDIEIHFSRPFNKKIPKIGKLRRTLDGGTRTAMDRKRDALRALENGSAVNPRLGALLSTASSASPPRTVEIQSWINANLDSPKRDAVKLALGSENFTLVQGPPGTGKTEFIVELIGQILMENPSASILLVSQTHVALDNALDRLKHGNITDKIARLGNSDSNQISQESKLLLPESQISRWAENLSESTWRFAAELAMDAGLTPPTAVGLTNLLKIRSSLEEIKMLEDAIDDDSIPQNAELLAPRIKKLNLEVMRGFQLLSEQLPGVSISKTLENVEFAIKALGNSITSEIKLLDILTLQSRWITKILVSDELESLFLKSRSVLAGTCIGFLSNPAVRNLDFDYCILDEASRANPAESLVPFAKSKRIVLVGDSRQLGPSNIELAGQNRILKKHKIDGADLQETLFKYLESELPEHSQVALDIQYRMSNPIGELISTCFYEGRIKSAGPDKLEGLNFFVQDDAKVPYYLPLSWIDTSSRPDRTESRSHKSLYNAAEAELVVGRIKAIAGTRSTYKLSGKRLRILVASPYAAQINLIRSCLEDFVWDDISIEVLSIDSIQGREADLVFFSPVRSNENPNNFGFITAERINVALSRARHSLVIVGDSSFWRAGTTKLGEVFEQMLELPSHVCEIVAET